MELEIEKTYVPHLYPEFASVSPERIEDWYAEVFDRWTWETGSDEDRELLERLDIERHYRRENKGGRKLAAGWTIEAMDDIQNQYGLDVEEELLDKIAQDITTEIDNEILKTLLPK